MTTEKKSDQLKMLVIALLALNVILVAYVAFFKKDAYRLETLKVGGSENMNMAQQLYKSDAYIQQNKASLEQYLWSMNQAAQPTMQQPTTEPTAEAPTPTETPEVTQ